MSLDTDIGSPGSGGAAPWEASTRVGRRRPAWLRRRDVFGIDLVVALLLIVPLGVGLAAHMRWGALYPPDSRYYVTMALRDMGMSPADALAGQLKVTGWPAESWYFSSTDPVWRMVQPRMLYPMLSVPFVWMFGAPVGMAVVPTVSMAVAVLAAARLVQRLYGPFAALAAAGVFAATGVSTWLTMAITDALAIALVALVLLRLPLRRRTTGRDLVWLALYSALLCMTRQVTPMIAGLVCGGWLWAFLFPSQDLPGRPRRLRNEWLAPAAVVAGVSVAGQAAFSWAYPYNVTQQFLYASDEPTLRGALLKLPSTAWSVAQSEVVNMLHNDRYLLFLMAAPLVYVGLRFRDVTVGLFLGGLGGTCVLTVANGVPSGMRYESVLAPVAALVLGALAHELGPVALRGGAEEPAATGVPRPRGLTVLVSTRRGRGVLRGAGPAALRLAAVAGISGVAGAAGVVGIVGWSATHGSRSVVGAVPTAPAAAAALAGSGHQVAPASREPADLILQDGLAQAKTMALNGGNWLYLIVDWRHPVRYRPLGPADPGWTSREPDGTAVVRFGDFTLPQQIRFGSALSLRGTVEPRTLKVLKRRTSRFGEDVTFEVADDKKREHTGRATVVYPLRPFVTGLVTQFILDS
jgi:hypothetical protein